ncbi:MAG: Activator of Hsp90 ATPase 1 family protein [Marmoricola sp.]|nr:Activator of Hsp90 ATPase 1 family protein [Marmoricola sp.]
MRGEVTVQIQARPDVVWDLVSDVTRIGEFSPETFEAVWLDGATGPAVGNRFKGHVKRNGVGPVYWTVCEVTDLIPERHFEFAVVVGDQTINRWGYRLEPAGGGTQVTEYFSLKPSAFTRVYWTLLGRLRGRTNERGMQQTLDRIKTIAEAS